MAKLQAFSEEKAPGAKTFTVGPGTKLDYSQGEAGAPDELTFYAGGEALVLLLATPRLKMAGRAFTAAIRSAKEFVPATPELYEADKVKLRYDATDETWRRVL